jgi:uncharacterized protein (TIGR02611 family)
MWVKTLQQAKRLIRIVTGFAVLLAGIVMLVAPGPGWLTIAGGLAILAVDFIWARRLLDRIKAKGVELKDAVLKKSPARQSD